MPTRKTNDNQVIISFSLDHKTQESAAKVFPLSKLTLAAKQSKLDRHAAGQAAKAETDIVFHHTSKIYSRKSQLKGTTTKPHFDHGLTHATMSRS